MMGELAKIEDVIRVWPSDANFVLTATGNIIEIQATAEKSPFSEANFLMLLNAAKKGISELFILQQDALSKV